MGKRLEIQQKFLQQMVADLQRLARGLHLIAVQDIATAKKHTPKP